MSPLPSPSPLRRSIARIVFSPAGLLFGFLAIVIVACPGARSSEPEQITARTKAVLAGGSNSARFILMTPTPVNPKPRVIGRSRRFDGIAPASVPATGPEGSADALRNVKAILPLLVDPLLTDAPRVSAANSTPMTGQPVGI
ncbi:MAG: hypothetical protein ACKON8_09435, partial [Planctomycetota bacterium]